MSIPIPIRTRTITRMTITRMIAATMGAITRTRMVMAIMWTTMGTIMPKAALIITTMDRAPTISIITARCRKRSA